jgi:hypothetical protein
MAELIKFYEVVGTVLYRAHQAGKFVVGHLAGGAWADLPHNPVKPGVPPQRPPGFTGL